MIESAWPCTVFTSAAAAEVHEALLTGEDLAEPPIARSKKSMKWVKLARFGQLVSDKGSYRHDANVIELLGVELDYDGEQIPMETATSRLQDAGIYARLYTSPSHTPEAPRWRILVPFEQPYSGTTEQLKAYRTAAMRAVVEVLGFDVSGESYTLSQSYYFGRLRGAPYESHETTGDYLDALYEIESYMDSAPINGHASDDPLELLKNIQVNAPTPGVDVATQERKIRDGGELHRPLLSLTSHYAAKGLPAADIETEMYRLLDQSARRESNPPSWQKTRDDVPRLVAEAVKKFAPVTLPDTLPQLDLAELSRIEPPPRQFLLADADGQLMVPAGEGCGLAAPGGSGKSIILLDLGVALSSGRPWLGHFEPQAATPVFYFTMEDSGDELHRRLWGIAEQNPGALDLRHLHIFPLLGIQFPLTVMAAHGAVSPGPAVERIVEIVNAYGGSGLVMIDPLRKVTAGKEDGEAMNAAILACDRIRLETSGVCTTLVAHHTAKVGVKEPDRGATAFRGATDLVDGLRWTMTMSRLGESERKKIPDASNWRRLSVPKTNYSASNDDGLLVCWENGRFVVMDTPAALMPASLADNVEQLHAALLASGPQTPRWVREMGRAKEGPVYCAKAHMDQVIALARQEGLIEECEIEAANGQRYPAWKAT